MSQVIVTWVRNKASPTPAEFVAPAEGCSRRNRRSRARALDRRRRAAPSPLAPHPQRPSLDRRALSAAETVKSRRRSRVKRGAGAWAWDLVSLAHRGRCTHADRGTLNGLQAGVDGGGGAVEVAGGEQVQQRAAEHREHEGAFGGAGPGAAPRG